MQKIIELICDYCGNSFKAIEWQWRKNRKRSPNFTDIVCKRTDCVKKRKSLVYSVMVEKNKESGHYKKIAIIRKGKKVEDFLGIEKGGQMREKVRKARLKQKDPRKGKKHKENSKKKMQKSRLEYLKSNPDISKEHSKIMKKKWRSLSKEQREKIRENASERMLHRKWKNSCKTGYIKYWYSNNLAFYESSYEEKYFNILNIEKKLWKKNTTIKIPYKHPIDKENHFYIPDILIFKSDKFTIIKEIIEIKPSVFIKDNGKPYNSICITKKKSLEKFCSLNNIKSTLITELDL